MILHSIYYISSSRYRDLGVLGSKNKPVSIVVPVKNEPEELLIDLIRYLGSLGGNHELIIISDDPPERALKLKRICEDIANSLGVRLKFIVGGATGGSRTKALNRGVSEASYDYILIMDVDARPEGNSIEKLVECIELGYDACVGRWKAYYDVGSRLAHSISAAMKYTVDVLYKGRSALNLFIFPLGSGTLFRRESLLRVGLWDEVIQDDMYIGVKFLVNGLKIRYIDNAVINVMVPSTYAALRIQQGRWAYGAVETLKKFLRMPMRSRVSFNVRLEAAAFLGQYIPTVMLFIGSLVIPITSLIIGDDVLNLGIAGLSVMFTTMLFYTITIYRSLISVYRNGIRIIRIMGSSAAITVTLIPVIFVNTIKSLLGLRARYMITPKGSHELKLLNARYLLETTYLVYLICVSITNLLFGNILTALWCIALASAVIYVFSRAEKV